jgi:FkbM family methyltransferase|tara:strand:- start:5759 stop:6472 length:714 start_codon:yes stop_codon:yes gene_type:complete
MKILLKSSIFFFDIIDKFIHQKRIIKFFKKKKIKIQSFVDVGSHKGLYTDLFIQNYSIKKVMMFEPQIKIFNFLKKKYTKNKKIKIFNYAASNKTNFQNLQLNHHDLTTTLSKFNENNFYLRVKALLFGVEKMAYQKIKIKTIQLADVMKKNKIYKVDLLKIDTEGHELEVLEGLKKKIKEIQFILIEFHRDKIYLKYSPKKIHNYLLKNNFILKAKFKFPFTSWEDRIYFNKNANR